MEAIRRFVTVKDHTINITLPDDFTAEEVEVIILSKTDDFFLNDEIKSILDSRVNEPIEHYISGEESINRLKNKYGL